MSIHINRNKGTYLCCAITETGRAASNEDSVLIGKTVLENFQMTRTLKGGFFAAVADGVSNSNMGACASKMCLEYLCRKRIRKSGTFKKSVIDIHEKIVKYGQKHRSCLGMQTTLCALYVAKNGRLLYANVGDSRLYRFRSSKLKQISKDQSFVEMLYDKGKISNEQKRSHSGRNLVLTVIGAETDTLKPEAAELDETVQNGDIYLLCTDGLSDYVLDSEIESVLVLPEPLESRLQKLTQAALKNGSTDNISICAVTKCK